MSLYDRVVLAEARSSTTFTKQKGSDAFQHTDRWKAGRRNKTPQGTFVEPKWKRYPVNAFSRASAAGSLRQAYDRGKGKKVAGKVKSNTALNMCPAVIPGCDDRRGQHGQGGRPEHKTSCQGKHCNVKDSPMDHGGQYPWKFNVDKRPEWKGSDWESAASGKGKPKKKAAPKKKKKQQKGGLAAAFLAGRKAGKSGGG